MPRIGLALSGGAARCIAQIGVLEVFTTHGIPIAALAGTSGGALIGALYASGLYDGPALERLARAMRWRRMMVPSLTGLGLINSERIYRVVADLIGPRTFADLTIPLHVVASDLRDGEKVVLTHGSVARAVQASCSLPVVFTPTRLNGRLLVDGGTVSQLPVVAAREALGPDPHDTLVGAPHDTCVGAPHDACVVAVDVNGQVAETAPLNNVFQVAYHYACLFARRNAAAEKRLADVVIEVDSRGISLYDFGKVDLLLDRGRAAAEAKVGEIRERLSQPVPHG